MKPLLDISDLGTTFQMSLDTFLEESHPSKHKNIQAYTTAVQTLEECKKIRSWHKKQDIAKQAMEICPDCIEAFLVQGLYEIDYLERLHIYKEGMELATMNLGKDFFLHVKGDFIEYEEAKPLLRIKFAYAQALFESGYMRKAQQQFHEIVNFNSSDKFHAHYYLYVTSLYFEEYETCKALLEKYKHDDTMGSYVYFLYHMKKESFLEAKQMLPILKEKNIYLYNIMTYKTMNTSLTSNTYRSGSEEEAGFMYPILSKIIHTMEYLHVFMVTNEK